jgi:hypothetical protein
VAHVRVQNAELAFGPFVYEHHIVLPDRDREQLQEVGLRLYGLPTQAVRAVLQRAEVPGAASRSGPHDVRLYVEQAEITQAFIAELKAQLDRQDQARLFEQYRFAMDKWIDMARALGDDYGHDVQTDIDARDAFLGVRPFSALIDQLGNVQAGNAGFMHAFNFLHCLIDLPPVSMRAVALQANRQTGAELIDLHRVHRLTISAGPSRFHTDPWQPTAIFGRVKTSG